MTINEAYALYWADPRTTDVNGGKAENYGAFTAALWAWRPSLKDGGGNYINGVYRHYINEKIYNGRPGTTALEIAIQRIDDLLAVS